MTNDKCCNNRCNQARVTAAFWSWAFGLIAGLALAIEGVE